MLSCLVVSYTQRPSGFKAIIQSIFKTNLPSLSSFSRFFRPFFLENYKILQKCEQKWNIFARNLSIIKSQNKKIKKCLLFPCRHAVVIMQTLNWTNHSVRYSWQSAILLRSVRIITHAQWSTHSDPRPRSLVNFRLRWCFRFPGCK
jgi:hypothetical protein